MRITSASAAGRRTDLRPEAGAPTFIWFERPAELVPCQTAGVNHDVVRPTLLTLVAPDESAATSLSRSSQDELDEAAGAWHNRHVMDVCSGLAMVTVAGSSPVVRSKPWSDALSGRRGPGRAYGSSVPCAMPHTRAAPPPTAARHSSRWSVAAVMGGFGARCVLLLGPASLG